jgi:predicted Fe-Mo cluster-binding NifX family protein
MQDGRTRRLALAIWQDRISPVFDVSRRILLVDVQDGRIVNRYEQTLEHDAPLQKVRQLAQLGVGTLICGAVSRPLAALLAAYDIRTIPFIAGDVDEVMDASLAGNLPSPELAMPGCGGRKRIRRGRGCAANTIEEDDMPGGDGTGPGGQGPRTGRGRGGCRGQGGGRGRGQGGGRGRGQGGGRGKGQGGGRGKGQGGGQY